MQNLGASRRPSTPKRRTDEGVRRVFVLERQIGRRKHIGCTPFDAQKKSFGLLNRLIQKPYPSECQERRNLKNH